MDKEQSYIVFDDKIKYYWKGYLNSEGDNILYHIDNKSSFFKNKLKDIIVDYIQLFIDTNKKHQNNLSLHDFLKFVSCSIVETSPFKSKVWLDTLRLLFIEEQSKTLLAFLFRIFFILSRVSLSSSSWVQIYA